MSTLDPTAEPWSARARQSPFAALNDNGSLSATFHRLKEKLFRRVVNLD